VTGPSGPEPLSLELGPAQAWFTGRAQGDLGRDAGAEGERRRRAVVDLPWHWAHQVHGAGVVWTGPVPGGGPEPTADAVLTDRGDLVSAVFTADCAPVVLACPEGLAGAVHAGWRGLVGGVLEAAVEALRGAGGTTVLAAVGPCIHACCYEFGAADLDRVAGRAGPVVRGETALGRPALDLPAGVRAVLVATGVTLVWQSDACTGCTPGYFSHRARGDLERQAAAVTLR
jgi:YfiH family protein